jgi:hypothetical protein
MAIEEYQRFFANYVQVWSFLRVGNDAVSARSKFQGAGARKQTNNLSNRPIYTMFPLCKPIDASCNSKQIWTYRELMSTSTLCDCRPVEWGQNFPTHRLIEIVSLLSIFSSAWDVEPFAVTSAVPQRRYGEPLQTTGWESQGGNPSRSSDWWSLTKHQWSFKFGKLHCWELGENLAKRRFRLEREYGGYEHLLNKQVLHPTYKVDVCRDANFKVRSDACWYHRTSWLGRWASKRGNTRLKVMKHIDILVCIRYDSVGCMQWTGSTLPLLSFLCLANTQSRKEMWYSSRFRWEIDAIQLLDIPYRELRRDGRFFGSFHVKPMTMAGYII